MMTGMIVIYDGQPMTVAGITGTVPAYSGGSSHTVYELAPLLPTRVYLNDPKAYEIPLLPPCPTCGVDAEPGRWGAPGWPCNPTCLTGVAARMP